MDKSDLRKRLDEIAQETAKLFFENGRLGYQIDSDSGDLASNKNKLHNLNTEAKRLQKQLQDQVKLEVAKCPDPAEPLPMNAPGGGA